jgi:diacylglycerol kinase (ATP)
MPPAVAIILNGISRKKKKFYRDFYPILAEKFTLKVFETGYAGHALELAAAAAVDQRFDFIIAAGGDGTLNQVINGVQRNASRSQSVLGLLPLGTGNDFARTCGLSADAGRLCNLIKANEPKPVDLGKISCRDHEGRSVIRYFINACSVGMGPAVVQRLTKSNRSLGPTLTYWKAITATFLTHRPQEIHGKTPFWDWRGKIRVLAVANGRSFGNSLYIAPDAVVDDGLLNVFIAGDLPLLRFLRYQHAMKSAAKIRDAKIQYHQTARIELQSPVPCAIEAEGELAGFLPAEIEIVPGAVGFLR